MERFIALCEKVQAFGAADLKPGVAGYGVYNSNNTEVVVRAAPLSRDQARDATQRTSRPYSAPPKPTTHEPTLPKRCHTQANATLRTLLYLAALARPSYYRPLRDQAREAFADSHGGDAMAAVDGAPRAAAARGVGKEASSLRLGEFTEAVARLGRAKYEGVAGMSLKAQVEGALDNLVGRRTADEVVADATPQAAVVRYSAATALPPLPAERAVDMQEWVHCWGAMRMGGLHGFPLWEQVLLCTPALAALHPNASPSHAP